MENVELGKGISAVLPSGWEYSAETLDGISTLSVQFTNGSCSAELELANNCQISPKEFVSTYRFNLMRMLVDLGFELEPLDTRFPFELISTGESIEGKVVHVLIPTDPVVHLSAITLNDGDLSELRLIIESIRVDEKAKVASDDDYLPIELGSSWHKA